jgi:phenylacetate-CoA ligase
MKIRKSPSAIQQTQFKRIQSLGELAYNESAFYRSIKDRSGFHPSQFQKIDDMKRIPIINRKMIQDAQDADVQALVPESKRAGISWKKTTSGSSGLPITIFASRSERLRILGIILRDYRLN